MPQAVQAFGKPNACTIFTDKGVEYEAWRYDDHAINSLYLVFKDGKLDYYFRK